MNVFYRQFYVLLWKCWLIKRKHYIVFLIEFFLPLFTSILMIFTVASFKNPTNDLGKVLKNKSNIAGPTIYNSSVYNFKKNISKYRLFLITVLIAPDEECWVEFGQHLKRKLSYHSVNFVKLKYFKKEDDLVKNFIISKNNYTFMAGIVFESDCNDLKNFSYKLRTYSFSDTDTGKLFPTKLNPGPIKTNYYLEEKYPLFIEFEILINQIHLQYIQKKLNQTLLTIDNVHLYKYPYPSYIEKAPSSLIDFLPTVIVYGFIVFFPVIVKRMTDEKENNIKEIFRLMGLNDWVYFGSSFIHYFIILIFQMLILTFLFLYPFGISAVINYSNPLLIYIILLAYGINLVLLAMLITTFFKNSVLATIVSLVVYYITNILIYFVDPKYNRNLNLNSTSYYLLFLCIFPNSALNFIIRIISLLELYNDGAKFSNLFQTTFQYGVLSVGSILTSMFISSFVLCILIWYIDNVWPFNNALVKPWYFPFAYLLNLSNKRKRDNDHGTNCIQNLNNKFFEKENDFRKNLVISIKNVYKKFDEKTVLSNICLDLYSGQLVALLGQNGAGKTTLMNIICGLFLPTKGRIFINNHDIQINTKLARRSISLCPQHNFLYSELTVAEHLYLYGMIKNNLTSSELNIEISDLLKKFNLTNKANIESKKLSGGMKRKLNLAISLIGDSKIVILDEPTSGMDPEARRSVWDILLEEKKTRTILLTTHFIEEADILGDKIFIMSNGISKCYGSPSFLKRIFGFGYQLRLAKKEEFNTDEEVKKNLTNFIAAHFKHSTTFNENVKELIYCLDSRTEIFNESNDDNSQIISFFKEFENKLDKFKICSFGITIITLEDVFLNIINTENGKLVDKGSFSSNNKSCNTITSNQSKAMYNTSFISDSISNFNFHQEKLKGFSLVFQRLKGLLIKRLNHSKRYYPMIIFQLVLPLGIFYLIFYIDNYLRPKTNEETCLDLDISKLYGPTNTFFSSNLDNSYLKSYEKIARRNNMKFDEIEFETNLTSKINNYLLNITKHNSISQYIKQNLASGIFNKTGESKLDLHGWFNNEATHSLPISIILLFQALKEKIMAVMVDNGNNLVVKNSPFPSQFKLISEILSVFLFKIMWTILVSITLPFLGASYSMFPLHENITKSKLLQIMAGCNSYLYWMATFIYDIINHTVICCLILIFFFIFDVNQIFIFYPQSMSGLYLLLFLFGLCSMQIAYIFSRYFKSVSSGFLIITIFYLIFGVLLSIVNFLLVYLVKSELMNETLYDVLVWIFRFFPLYSMSKGIVKLYELGSKNNICMNLDSNLLINCKIEKLFKGCCPQICGNDCYFYKSPYHWQDFGILKEVLALFLIFILSFIFNILLDENIFKYITSYFRSIIKKNNALLLNENHFTNYVLESGQDSDVIQEKKRVDLLLKNTETNMNVSLIVNKLKKVFSNDFIAVDELTFVLNKQECFGLLGINGAGKTTTFKMLVGDIEPTSGNAYIDKFSLKNNCKKFQKNIGYCPQFDALLDNLTGEEMLYLFGRLRGIPENNLKKCVLNTVEMIDLTLHYKNICSNYSGGNRRKLSLGLALIGLPKIIFLDEPTSGVDSEAKRKIWKTLTEIKRLYNCSIVLTSHSMEECEALCSRIAIMINGKFKCLNSIQNLRKKYGKGFSLLIKLKLLYTNDHNYLLELKNNIQIAFPSAILEDFHNTFLNYQIIDTKLGWAFMFEKMDYIKKCSDLEYYLLCDTTLEQIFINFAKNI